MPSRPRVRVSLSELRRRDAAIALVAAVLALLIGWLISQSRAQEPGAAAPSRAHDSSGFSPPPAPASARLPCVSYAPFRRPGHTPLDPAMHVSPAEIEADLRLLATISGCVRTYGVSQGLEAVPAIARRLGLRVLLGAWIDGNPAHDERELGRAIALAREHADVVDLLLVGNEVLLRGDRSPGALIALLDRARREQPVPVAYADVWAYWLRHAEALRGHVDVAAVHVLPYWDDEPVAIDQAAAYVLDTLKAMREALAPLPVFIAETGWPAAGRQRGPAAPGPLAQVRLVRELLAARADWGWQPGWNLIEGFDQPWKRVFEGAMGGYWGVYTADGERRVSFSGPIVPDPHALRGLLAAALGALLGTLAAGPLGLQRLPLALAGALTGLLAQLQVVTLSLWSLNAGQTLLGTLIAMPAAACALAVAIRLAAAPGTEPRAARLAARWLPASHAGTLAACLLLVAQLLLDGRYRPLLWPIYAVPAVLLPALWLAGGLPRLRGGAAGAIVLLAAAAALLWHEGGAANHQALLAALACAGIACPALGGVRAAERPAQRGPGSGRADGAG